MEEKKKKRPNLAKIDYSKEIKENEPVKLDTFTNEHFTIDRNGIKMQDDDGNLPSDSSKYTLKLSPDDLEKNEFLGEGAGGSVYKVTHKKTGEVWAQKSIPSGTNIEQHMLDTEVSIQTKCQSKHIVKTYGAFLQDGKINIALELMDLGTIHDLIKVQNKIEEPVLGIIALQTQQGLHDLHKGQKVIHRDIKPQNLLVNSKGDVKIADFGVSKQNQSTMQSAYTWVGTVKYMSPERFSTVKYNADCDLWAQGMVLLECALGHYPYNLSHADMNMWNLKNAIENQPAPSAPEGFSRQFRDFIKICLNKNVGGRGTAKKLQSHPWIVKCAKIPKQLFVDWLKDYAKKKAELK